MGSGMNSREIRKAYIEFFEARGHTVVPSAPLIPKEDPTLLFNSAGMVPFKPYYLTENPPYRRAVSSQRCLRLSDLEEVGHSPYHDTFFEMLGNFSFGDYFKTETIEWAWEFLTQVVRLPADRLWVTVYKDDEAAADIWRTRVGFPSERIVALGDKDNFWGPAGDSGPCGPCSEIHYDMGPEIGCGERGCKPGCDCRRFFEVWNLVFPQYLQHPDGTREALKRPGIDTGMGLERLATVLQGANTIFETDLFAPIIEAARGEAERATGRRPGAGEASTELSVIADHARAATFCIAENILPSNEGQGYVVRRLLRRAVRRGLALGIENAFLYRMAGTVVDALGDAHPHIDAKREHIALVIKSEEERFHSTLTQGTAVFEDIVDELSRDGSKVISGDKAFSLYDTYGFPLDLTQEMARERGLSVDVEGFRAGMDAQKERGRRASAFGGGRPWRGRPVDSTFTGYDLAVDSAAAVEEVAGGHASAPVRTAVGEIRDGAVEGEAEFTLERTPFYAESGGQVADTGWLSGDGIECEVVNVYIEGDRLVHVAVVEPASLERSGLVLSASVDMSRRRRIEKNHTATHLLQAALRRVLGDHVHQSGSWVGPDRLRFDFTHFSDVSPSELSAVEDLVNAWIRADLYVSPKDMQIQAALDSGAMALFGEKYSEDVRVVCISDGSEENVSMELCGGTHARTTGEIGAFSIIAESSVAAGVRRIEAVSGADATRKAREDAALVRAASEIVRGTPEDLLERVREAAEEVASLRKELARERVRAAGDSVVTLVDEAREVEGVRVVCARTEAADVRTMRSLADRLRDKLGSGVGVLGADIEGASVLIAFVTDDVVADGRLKAGDIVREVAAVMGGRGGGKPHLAQAGGGDVSRLDEALEAGYSIVEDLARG